MYRCDCMTSILIRKVSNLLSINDTDAIQELMNESPNLPSSLVQEELLNVPSPKTSGTFHDSDIPYLLNHTALKYLVKHFNVNVLELINNDYPKYLAPLAIRARDAEFVDLVIKCNFPYIFSPKERLGYRSVDNQYRTYPIFLMRLATIDRDFISRIESLLRKFKHLTQQDKQAYVHLQLILIDLEEQIVNCIIQNNIKAPLVMRTLYNIAKSTPIDLNSSLLYQPNSPTLFVVPEEFYQLDLLNKPSVPNHIQA